MKALIKFGQGEIDENELIQAIESDLAQTFWYGTGVGFMFFAVIGVIVWSLVSR